MSPQITEFGLTISDADNLTMDHPWSRYSSNIATYLMVYLWVSLIIVSTYPKIYRKADHPSPFGAQVNFCGVTPPLRYALSCMCRNNVLFTLPLNSSTIMQLSRNEPRCLVVGAMGLWRSLGRFQLYQMSQLSRVIATIVSYRAIIGNLNYLLRK